MSCKVQCPNGHQLEATGCLGKEDVHDHEQVAACAACAPGQPLEGPKHPLGAAEEKAGRKGPAEREVELGDALAALQGDQVLVDVERWIEKAPDVEEALLRAAQVSIRARRKLVAFLKLHGID